MLRKGVVVIVAYAAAGGLLPAGPAASGNEPYPATEQAVQLGQVVLTQEGSSRLRLIKPQGGRCAARVRKADTAGVLDLSIQGPGAAARSKSYRSVTGLAWVTPGVLVFTSGSYDGTPGVFAYSCAKNHTRVVMEPPLRDDGEFVLQSVEYGPVPRLLFYFGLSLEKGVVDWSRFRTPAYLFQINLDGSGFQKAGE